MLSTHERLETLNVAAERSDDIPVLIAHMRRMDLPQILDRHIPARACWSNLSIGWTAVVWLAHLLSCSHHRSSAIQQWVSAHSETLRWCTGRDVTPADVGIDRRRDVLIGLSRDTHWQAIETDLNRQMLGAWALAADHVHLRLYEGRSWHIAPDGSFQINKAHPWRARTLRPSVLLATLSPSNMPLITRSFIDDHLSPALLAGILADISGALPQQRHRFVGNALTAVELRGAIHMRNDEYLVLLPDVSVDPAHLLPDHRLADAPALVPVCGGGDPSARRGAGWYTPVSVEINGATITWNERRIAARSPVQAHLLEESLRTRLARAREALLALGQRKRGKRRLRSLEALQEAAQAILDSYQVYGLLRLDVTERIEERLVRRYRGRPTGVRVERDVQVAVSIDDDALDAAIRRLGWQIFGSNIPPDVLPANGVLSIAAAPVPGFERLHGRPLSLAPHDVPALELEIGVVRFLALGLRALALLETIARLQLLREGVLSAFDDERGASRTTGERLLDAFCDILTVPGMHRLPHTVSPLSPLQQRVLHLLALSPEIYQETR